MLKGATSEFQAWILDKAVLGIAAAGTTFFAYSADPKNVSWVVMNLQAGNGSKVINDKGFMKKVLVAVVKHIWENKGLLQWALRYLQARTGEVHLVGKLPLERLVDITHTFCITYIETGKPKKEIDARYQIHGRPASAKSPELKAFAELVHNLTFPIQKNHACFICLYLKTKGWLGMMEEQLQKFYDTNKDWKPKPKVVKNADVERKNGSKVKHNKQDNGFTSVQGKPCGGKPGCGRGHQGGRGAFYNPPSGSGRGYGGPWRRGSMSIVYYYVHLIEPKGLLQTTLTLFYQNEMLRKSPASNPNILVSLFEVYRKVSGSIMQGTGSNSAGGPDPLVDLLANDSKLYHADEQSRVDGFESWSSNPKDGNT
ncbi:hypothetical protein L218DRAFT_944066 [Marasmius fiardii PR-910]|nr:hypothetical protein L218DRAFT_944066 [Marasmius fiardii PR-910]